MNTEIIREISENCPTHSQQEALSNIISSLNKELDIEH